MTSPRRRKQQSIKEKGKQSHQRRNGKSPNGESMSETTTNKCAPIVTADAAAMICAMFGFLLYVNAIYSCGFCYDDIVAIEKNPDVLNTKGLEPTSWWQVFQHDYWGTPVTDGMSHKSYRPLAILSFRLDMLVAETLGVPGAAWVFHFFNALFYAVTCWMVVKYMLASVTPHAGMSVLLSGLWFAAHPVHVESVTGLVGRADILAAILCTAGARLYAVGGWSVACCLCFAAACLCKETSVVIPAVLAVADVAKAVVSLLSKNKHPSNRNLSSAPSLVAVSVGYIMFRSWLFGGESQTLSGKGVPLTDNFLQHLTPSEKLRTAIWIQVRYLLLLVWPNKLSCDYGLGVIDPVRSWASLEILHSVAMVVVIFMWARYSVLRLYQTGDAASVLAMGWTLGPLVPASHIVDIGTVMAERLLFLPTIGAAMLLCHVLGSFGRRSFLLWAALVVCIVLFANKTVIRNPDWASSHSLFAADLETYPRSLKMLISNIAHEDISESISVKHADTAQGILDENADLFSTDAIEDVRGKILLKMADLKMNSSDTRKALAYADDILERHTKARGSLNVKAYAKKGRALLKLGVENGELSTFKDAAEAYRLATQAGKVVDDEYWFDINEGKGRAFFEVWRSTGDPTLLAGAAEAFRVVSKLGDVFGGNDKRWSDILFFAGKTLFAFGVASADLEVFQEAAADFRKAIRLGNISGDERWADLHKEFGKTLLQLGPATRDLKLVKEAAAVFETSIKHGDTEQKIHVFCMLGTALAMLDDRMAAYEQFQECFRRESESEESYVVLWEDRFGYRVNYAVLMQKLSGVSSQDSAAIQKWGQSALEAIDVMLNMSKKEGGISTLPADKLRRWYIVKRAIEEQLDLRHSEL